MTISEDIEGSSRASGLSFEVSGAIEYNTPDARLGRLSIAGRNDIDTPNFFSISSRGVVPHLTPDVIGEHTQPGGVHIALEDFIERATIGTPPIMNVPGNAPLHTFTCLPTSFITLLAPRRTPAVIAPVGNTNTAISIFTSTGFQSLSNKAYVNYAEKLHPDIIIGLADVPHGTVPGVKRIGKMGDRTEGWLTELLASEHTKSAVFAPILPIEYHSQFEYLNNLDEFADKIRGLAFYDSNLLPDIPATTAVAQLPRLSLDEPSSPHEILRQISLGMDIFTIPFIGFATDAGIALDFQFPSPSKSSEVVSTGNGSTTKSLGVDMWSTEHSTSLDPLSVSCECYACTTHHRSFIQHLLSAKEMLGWALLQIHNHYVLSKFFSSIREGIGRGTFEADCETFARYYETKLPEKSGQGPRVRGYQFKTEGPGERKKNQPGWRGDLEVA
ncbi:hypothetical protein HYFRA_00003626 [Hymenoscyphus fraxineus]|uniref:Queuine tRNA-ribosyltransferase accessory subunit 2 n=1 Tax=Hymenoscyphus fraxineus TaxID=746836 RepID=A0A9N9KYD9_9HELO|nr:hypothetical protein HYFRA_00003626 [Hymenoscyphus fraxineus]